MTLAGSRPSLAAITAQLTLQKAEPGRLVVACPSRALAMARRLAEPLAALIEQAATGRPGPVPALQFVADDSALAPATIATATAGAPSPGPATSAGPTPGPAPTQVADLPADQQPTNHPLVRTVIEALGAKVVAVTARARGVQ